MASKYKLCTQLADICVELGFKGDLGYQTFLYCNESDLRRVFLFLLERIPKDEIQDLTTTNLTGDNLIERIVKKPFSITWIPPIKQDASQSSLPTWRTKPICGILNAKSIVGNRMAPNRRNFYDNYARVPLDDIGSLIRWNAAQLNPTFVSANKRTLIENIEFIGRRTIHEGPKHRESLEEKNLQSSPESTENQQDNDSGQLDTEELLKRQVSQLEEELRQFKDNLASLDVLLGQQSQTIKEAEEIFKLESDKLIGLRTTDKNLIELRNEAEQVKSDIKSFQEQWAVMSGQLLQNIDNLKSEKQLMNQRRNNMLQELHNLRKSSRSKIKEISEKEALIEQMKEKIKQPLPPNRSFYTQRIMELVNNVKKQNGETKKILLETRQLQKDINIASGKVQRAYTITDETIFRDAKSSEWNRKCYKLLATMHKNYDQLLDCVNAIGTIRREILQLEEEVDNERDNKTISNLDRIQQDLEQLRTENRLLMANSQASKDS